MILLAAATLFAVARPVETTVGEDSACWRASLAAVEASLAALGPPAGVGPREAGPLEAGVARREIAPPLDWRVPLAGNRGLRFVRADGKRPESVWARALALRQGERRFTLVSADLLVVSPELARRVLAAVRDVPLASDELLLVAAHTHTGPGGYWDGAVAEASIGPFDPRVLDFLVEEIAATVLEAWQNVKSVEVTVGERSMPLTVKNRVRRDGPENPQLGLLRFAAADGSFTADVVSYSAHPTNLLGESSYSGDYPGLLDGTDGGVRRVALFLPGTIGDLKPAYDGVRDGATRARSIAEHLATRGLATLTLGPVAPVLESFEVEITMPPVQARLFRAPLLGSWVLRSWLARPLLPTGLDAAVVQVVRLGSVALVSAPADLASSVALPLLEEARRRRLRLFFVSMAESWIGYVMQEAEYLETGYKPYAQLHGPQPAPLFSAVYRRLIAALAERAAAPAVSVPSAGRSVGNSNPIAPPPPSPPAVSG